MWKTLPLVVTLIGIASPVTAQTNSNLCALLPDADVSAILGTPLKLSAKPVETHKAGGGTVRSQQCVYDTPGGGFGPTWVHIGLSEASDPTLAAQWFKEVAELYDKSLPGGKGQPVNGIGDEARAWGASVSMRKQSVMVDITVFRQDLDEQKKLEHAKQLAQKVAARIK